MKSLISLTRKNFVFQFYVEKKFCSKNLLSGVYGPAITALYNFLYLQAFLYALEICFKRKVITENLLASPEYRMCVWQNILQSSS